MYCKQIFVMMYTVRIYFIHFKDMNCLCQCGKGAGQRLYSAHELYFRHYDLIHSNNKLGLKRSVSQDFRPFFIKNSPKVLSERHKRVLHNFFFFAKILSKNESWLRRHRWSTFSIFLFWKPIKIYDQSKKNTVYLNTFRKLAVSVVVDYADTLSGWSLTTQTWCRRSRWLSEYSFGVVFDTAWA